MAEQLTRGAREALDAMGWHLGEIDRLSRAARDQLVANPREARLYLTLILEHGPKVQTLVTERLEPLLRRRQDAGRLDHALDALPAIADRLAAIERRLEAPTPFTVLRRTGTDDAQ